MDNESEKIYVVKGDTLKFKIVFEDEDENPVDLSGSKVYLTVKKNLNDSDDIAIIKKETTSHTDPTNGETLLTVSASESKLLKKGQYYYDAQVKFPSGDIMSIVTGAFEVLQDTTSRTT